MSTQRIPEATVARLPRYLQALVAAADADLPTMSSSALASTSGVNAAIVRKDLSHIGAVGTRGVGYDVDELVAEISRVLGLNVDQSAVIVGLGNLGRALAAYGGFRRRGFRVVGLLDADPETIGQRFGESEVESIDGLEAIVVDRDVSLAVLAVPAESAQTVADRLVASGVTALLNFAPVHLDVPEDVVVRNVDLATELQILSFYQQTADAVGRAVPEASTG